MNFYSPLYTQHKHVVLSRDLQAGLSKIGRGTEQDEADLDS